MRRTHGFHLSPQTFFIFSHTVQPDRKRTLLRDGRPGDGDPHRQFDRDYMEKLLYANSLTATDLKRIQRRYLVPEQFHVSAPSIEQAEVISEMGGKNSKHFKEFERARIKQETMVGKQQSLFYMLAKESEVLLSMRSWCLFSGFCFANFCSADVVCESDIPLCISASRIFPWK